MKLIHFIILAVGVGIGFLLRYKLTQGKIRTPYDSRTLRIYADTEPAAREIDALTKRCDVLYNKMQEINKLAGHDL